MRVGWIGTGVMGGAMAGHLLAAGHEVVVHTRTRARATALLEGGARWAGSPTEAAAGNEVVFTMVGTPDDVREVVLGRRGALAGCAAGAVLVDCTTSEPALAVEVAEAAAARDVSALDAPVSGGDVGAREARLSFMVGGDAAAVERVRPLLQQMGATVVHQGPPGAGKHTKVVNQVLVAASMVGTCEALLYAHRAGLDPEAVLRSVGSGAAGSWTLQHLAPRVLAGDFAPGFLVEHFLKDLRIALDEAGRLGIALPGLALARQLYVATAALGHGRRGTHALQLALAQLSGVAWPGAPGAAAPTLPHPDPTSDTRGAR